MFTRLFSRLKTFLKKGETTTKKEQDAPSLVDYSEELVNFQSGTLRICGTLTRPNTDRLCPAVVLIHGSGPHTRDEVIGPHKPFQLLADYLSRRGIAVLRYDKRGIAYSDGDYSASTFYDFADDAEAAFKFLHSREDIDTRQIGLAGHSQGGLIAPIVASRNSYVAFVVLLAAPAINADALLKSQLKTYDKIRGLDDRHIRHNLRLAQKANDIVRAEPNNIIAAQKIADLRRGHFYEEIHRPFMDSRIEELTSNGHRCFLNHDPRPVLSTLTCPVLALNGEKDMQVFADENLSSIRSCLSRNKKALAIKLAGLNHIFQTCKTGLPDEYELLPETLAPTVLQLISDWITKTTSH
ncbi:MAG: alpha/beta fold hydrolase [Candidatus Obscuribacterales bacterium]|nr:alpha/beta fold hydrolase [Candidatus Obscuribacterales bacterium]